MWLGVGAVVSCMLAGWCMGLRGQPEEPESLGLPTDEESFNHLHPMGSPPFSGTYHFVSSSFPEIDSRGFYENVFDGVGDYYPLWGDGIVKRNVLTRHDLRLRELQPRVSLVRSKRDVANSSKDHQMSKRSPIRHGRGMEMGSSGFHEDAFNSAFGDFVTMRKRRRTRAMDEENIASIPLNSLDIASRPSRLILSHLSLPYLKWLQNKHPRLGAPDPIKKRRPEMDSMGFHGDTFGGSFGDFETMKKRRPEMDSMGFHGDTFGGSFGDFETMRKRRPEMDSSGFHGDTFGGSFGDFETMRKRRPEMDSSGFHGDTFGGSFGDFETMRKRRPEMDSSGFHGDTFGSFGDFETMKKRRPEMDSAGFHGDTFGSFGGFETMKKRRQEMDSMGFHGDTFGGSFGDFETMKKRRPEMDSMGFHGDTFGGSLGDFETMKKRRPEMDSMGFHGDTFGGSFGDFETMKKRRPEMDSMGFHGDTFGGSFGDFETMKKRRPEMDSMGFHGDTFGSFGDFETMKRMPAEFALAFLKGGSKPRGIEKKKMVSPEDCNCSQSPEPSTETGHFDGVLLTRSCLQKCKLSQKVTN